MNIVWDKNRNIKLVFPGLQHPNSNTPKWRETIDTQKRAEELKVVNKNVFFFSEWIDYHERINFLIEADAAIYTHRVSIESEFSHRTRVLDHILAKLPTIATEGDFFAELIENKEIGVVAKNGDPGSIAEAILKVAEKENLNRYRKNIDNIRPGFDWSVTLADLREYLLSNPVKVYQVPMPIDRSMKGKMYRVGKKYIPKPAKKLIVKATPTRVRRKLTGK
jgi:glycosyltransferase involved in cell wall biosynthesis